MLVSLILKGRLSSYSKVPLANGMSGKDVAEKMLKENGIYDVKVVSAEGCLSDHYSSTLVNWILLIGVIMAVRGNPTLLLIGIILMSITVLFTLITLPVEFDASRRALNWLNHTNVTNSFEYPKAKDALRWAAMTYVVAALAAVVTLAQYILLYMGSRDRS